MVDFDAHFLAPREGATKNPFGYSLESTQSGTHIRSSLKEPLRILI